MSGTVAFEYLGTPPRQRPRWLPAAGLLAGVLVVAAAAFLWWSDSVRRSAADELSGVFAAAQARAESGERQVQGTLAYASPTIWSADVPEDVRAGLRDIVEASAADVAADLAALRAQASAATILPWHEEQRVAQQRLLDLVAAQQARFDGIAADLTDIDLVLADGPLPTGGVAEALRAAGADPR
jgi:hypothetical protein